MGCSESKHGLEVYHADQRVRSQLKLAENNMTKEQSKRIASRVISFKKFMSGDDEQLNKSTDTEETQEQESEDGNTDEPGEGEGQEEHDHRLFNEMDAEIFAIGLTDFNNGEKSNNSSLLFEHMQEAEPIEEEPAAEGSPLREKMKMESALFDVVLYETALYEDQITPPPKYQKEIASAMIDTLPATTTVILFPPMHEEEEDELSGTPEPLHTPDQITPPPKYQKEIASAMIDALSATTTVIPFPPMHDDEEEEEEEEEISGTQEPLHTHAQSSNIITLLATLSLTPADEVITSTSAPPPSPASPLSLPDSPLAPSEIKSLLAASNSSYSLATAMGWDAVVEEDEVLSLDELNQEQHGPAEKKEKKDEVKKETECVEPVDTAPVLLSTPVLIVATPVAPVEQPPKSKQVGPRLTKAAAARSAANNATVKATQLLDAKKEALSATMRGGDKLTTPRQTAKPVTVAAKAPTTRVSQLSKTLHAAPAKPAATRPIAVKPPLPKPALKAVVSQAPKFKTKPFEKAAEPRCRF